MQPLSRAPRAHTPAPTAHCTLTHADLSLCACVVWCADRSDDEDDRAERQKPFQPYRAPGSRSAFTTGRTDTYDRGTGSSTAVGSSYGSYYNNRREGLGSYGDRDGDRGDRGDRGGYDRGGGDRSGDRGNNVGSYNDNYNRERERFNSNDKYDRERSSGYNNNHNNMNNMNNGDLVVPENDDDVDGDFEVFFEVPEVSVSSAPPH